MELKKVLYPIFKSYSAVLFNSNLVGGIVLLILSFFNPNLGIGGFVSVISAYIFARFLGFKEEFLRLDYYI
ncbi:MAG: urea transporter [Desulfurobacteriaceae bacterium]